jgi:hypothetical protein
VARQQPADGVGAGGARAARRAEGVEAQRQPADERSGGAHAAAPRPRRYRARVSEGGRERVREGVDDE